VVVAVAAVVYLISIFGPIREQAPAGSEGQLAGATG
jgi:hypothetical protein